jgi:LemA protein
MTKGKIAGLGCLAIIIIAVLVIGSSAWGTYDGMVAAKETVESKWGDIEADYQRRADLIPSLVATVKGYAAHESQVLEAVTAYRSQMGSIRVSKDILNNPEQFQKFQKAQDGLSSAFSRLLLVREQYPDLKANQNFMAFQSQVEGTENRIGVSRKRFNEAAQVYNTKVKQFPGVIFARLFGFQEKMYFKSAPGSDKAPVVDFAK